MAWSDLISSLDSACLSQLGGISVIFTPQGGSGQSVAGLIQNPSMAEDFLPGGITGTSVVRLFVRFVNMTPSPRQGDTVTVNGITYVIEDVDVDTQGGAVLKLRVL